MYSRLYKIRASLWTRGSNLTQVNRLRCPQGDEMALGDWFHIGALIQKGKDNKRILSARGVMESGKGEN